MGEYWSSFRDWAAERTNHPWKAIEAPLARAVPNKIKAAYMRPDLFERHQFAMTTGKTCLD